MRAFALCLVLAGAAPAAAQPVFDSEVSVDQEAYAYGETISVRFAVHNESGETATMWAPSGCAPALRLGALEPPGEGGGCMLTEIPYVMPARGGFTWVWLLDPARLGVPDVDGEQTVEVSLAGSCGLGEYARTDSCSLGGSATFTAPRFIGGTLRIAYAPADADSVAALKRQYRPTVTDSTAYHTRTVEEWQIEGTPLSDAVAALGGNGVIQFAEVYRPFGPSDVFATSAESPVGRTTATPPAPNPTAATAAFTVRLAAPEAVTIDLVDVLGRRVATLHDGPLAGGADHRFVLQTRALPAGVYVVRVTGRSVRQSHRVTVAH